MELSQLLKVIQFILGGTFVTIGVTLVALPLGFILGLVLAVTRVFGGKISSTIVSIYSTGMRGVPVIVLLFVLYFIIAGAINISPFWAGSISLGIVSSAYQMEILRGAVLSVGSGQMMAARAIGMTKIQAIQNIILPQALRLAIPPWSNEASIVLKDSSLVYALGVPEILRRAQFMSASTYRPFIAFAIAAAIYFILVFLMSQLLCALERRLSIPGLQQ